MKTKILIAVIVVLIVGIFVVQYNIHKTRRTNTTVIADSQNGGTVKGVAINLADLNLPEIGNINIVNQPVRKAGVKEALIYAKNYLLMDINTGYILSEKDSNIQVPIASTTKIMTAIISLENYKLDDVITISKKAAAQIGSDINLRSNEKMTVDDLLHALLIQSGNDAAMALAEFMPNGGFDEFVSKMNKKAELLNMKDTQYKDPAGLDDTGYSTAFDLTIAMSYAAKIKHFRDIISTSEYTITSSDGSLAHKLTNSNRLIKSDEQLYDSSVIGGKTGFTPAAGHCLISLASKNNHELVSVVLHTIEEKADSSAKENIKLLQWGFSNYNF